MVLSWPPTLVSMKFQAGCLLITRTCCHTKYMTCEGFFETETRDYLCPWCVKLSRCCEQNFMLENSPCLVLYSSRRGKELCGVVVLCDACAHIFSAWRFGVMRAFHKDRVSI